MREAVRCLAYPVLLGGALAAAWWGLRTGWNEGALVAAVSVSIAVPILLLQRTLPYEQTWRGWHVDLADDLLHVVFSMGMATAAIKAFLFGAAVWLAGVLAASWGATVWPTEAPLLLQMLLALLISDFFAYWLHRGSHETSLLWRIHALHHSSERLYMLSSARNHPFSSAAAYAVGTLPLIVLGAQVETLAMTAVFIGGNGLLQHANIDYRFGPLNWVISTADLHRWHHSTVLEESCTNYCSNLTVWDHVFGTYFLPQDRTCREVGLGDDAEFPEGFVAHLASPFTIEA